MAAQVLLCIRILQITHSTNTTILIVRNSCLGTQIATVATFCSIGALKLSSRIICPTLETNRMLPATSPQLQL